MPANSVAILERLMEPGRATWSPETARALLRWDFQPADHARIAELSAKASAGELTNSEKEDLEEYMRVADFLAIVQSKARMALRGAETAA